MSVEVEIRKSELNRVDIIQKQDAPKVLVRLKQQRIETIELEAAAQLFLLENQIHDFRGQPSGHENSTLLQGTMVDAIGSEFDCSVELYQKSSSSNSKFLKLLEISENFGPDDLMLILWSQKRGRLGFINVSSASELTISKLMDGFLEGLPKSAKPGSGFQSETQAVPQGPELDPQAVPKQEGSLPREMSIDNVVEILWARSYGGSLAAESPASEPLPKQLLGPWSPGLAAVSELMSNRGGQQEHLLTIFLIGGPGAGKSTFAKHLLRSLSPTVEFPSGNNMRSWDLLLEGQPLRFVNDASIKSGEAADSLSEDITHAIKTESDLLVCANRGVVGDELNICETGANSHLFGTLAWLAQRERMPEDASVEEIVAEDYFQVSKVVETTGRSRIYAAIYLDVCSLLETQPRVESPSGQWEDLVAEKQTITLTRNDVLPRTGEAPIETLLSSLLELLPIDLFQTNFQVSTAHPVIANLTNLNDPAFRAGLFDGLRIAELNTGFHITYRMFWALAARLIFGSLVDEVPHARLFSGMTRIESALQEAKGFPDFMDLVKYRSPSCLFPMAPEDNYSENQSQDPVKRLFASIDPVKVWPVDFESDRPGQLNGERARELLLDAFQSVESDKSIFEILDEQDTLPPNLPSEFDMALDEKYTELVTGGYSSEEWPRALTLSYCQHLERFFATYFGNVAGGAEAELLAALWQSSPSIPATNDISIRLEALIKPRLSPQDGNSSPSLLPFLDSNLTPLLAQGNLTSRVAISLDNVSFRTRRQGPNLILELVELGQPLGHIKVDFAFLREVLASTGQAHGVTEATEFVQPRLDRVRGTKLAPTASAGLNRVLVVTGDQVRDLQVSQ